MIPQLRRKRRNSVATAKPVQNENKQRKWLDISYFKNHVFLVIALAAACFRWSVPQALFYFPAHATNLGYERTDAAYLVSINSVCDFIGRSCFGLISDRKFVKRIHEYSAT